MSIFDAIDPEKLKYFLAMGDNNSLSMAGDQSTTSLWNPPILSANPSDPVESKAEMPEVPRPPVSGKPGDVSGFANYGMQAPTLPDPLAQLRGLMAFAGDPHVNKKEDPFVFPPPGGLMAYLRSLGV